MNLYERAVRTCQDYVSFGLLGFEKDEWRWKAAVVWGCWGAWGSGEVSCEELTCGARKGSCRIRPSVPQRKNIKKGKGGTLGVWSVLTFVQVGKKTWWLKLGVIPNRARSWNSLVAGQRVP